jgi:glycosyltransferase involved in cell wall biosynthesis
MPWPVSVVIPALNEAEAIGKVVASLPWKDITECIVVDNGSTDATAQVAESAGARVVTSPQGYGAAVSAGAAAAMPESTILVFMDGDGSDIPEEMLRLVGPIERDEADFVIGSRLRGRREPGAMNLSQVLAGRLVGWLVWRRYKFRYTDMGPYRAIRRSMLEHLGMTEMTYGWNLEMQIRAVLLGLRVKEVPVDYRRRIAGESKVSGNWGASWKAGTRILGVLRRVRKSTAA